MGAQPRVLYIINKRSDTSIPLEVADHFGEGVDVKVAAYYRPDDTAGRFFDGDTEHIGARGRFDPRGPRGLYRLIRQFRPHVIHVHHTLSSLWGSVLGRALGVPVIVKTEHSDHRRYEPYQDAANVFSLALADCVICNSDHTRASYHSWEKPLASHKSVTIYNGVDLHRIAEGKAHARRTRADLKASEETFLLGSVGRLVREKNYERLIRAVARVSLPERAVRLVIAGGGALRSRLEREIEQRGLGERVTLLGGVSRERVYQLLHAVDAFVMPSRWEGFCNAVVEAMAAGCPILASDIGTLREVVGPVGMYADPDSAEAWATAIERMAIMGAREREKRGREARTRAKEKFTVQRTARRYTDTYLDLLEKMDFTLS